MLAARFVRRLTECAGVVLLVGVGAASAHPAGSYLNGFSTITSLTSTVPGNGDVNPYGLVTVPVSTGNLVAGDLLVSNFNNMANLQGTGTTIDQITPSGTASLFAQIDPMTISQTDCPGGIGLTTALVALRSGFVIVGSLPTADGSSATAQAGCLLVLDSSGNVVETLHGGPINGPWDMTAIDQGQTAVLFVTNVLNGTVAGGGNEVDQGTVVRIRLDIDGGAPTVASTDVIATGFAERTDPAALVIGPTGLGFGIHQRRHALFVADTFNSRIAMIPNAMHRKHPFKNGGVTVSTGGGLNQPLGLSIAPNGNIITVNGGDGNAVETTPTGHHVATTLLDSAGGGVLFGVDATSSGMFFVDDGDNTLRLWH
jgi:hypothetical protein